MNTLNKTVSYISLGLSTILAGCEENKNVEAVRGRIDNIEIRVVNNIMSAMSDNYTLEIYNSKGDMKARLLFLYLPNGFIHYDDKLVNFRNGEFLTEDKSSYKAEK